jgi:hypothetical protein
MNNEILTLTLKKYLCKTWNSNNNQFGICQNPNTFFWVKGDSFEPPFDFGCINHSELVKSENSIENLNKLKIKMKKMNNANIQNLKE